MGLKKTKPVVPAKMHIQKGDSESFSIRLGTRQRNYTVMKGYGYFVPSFKKATNLSAVTVCVDKGIAFREIQTIIDFFDLKVPEIAKAASVSASTVSRWEMDSPIGSPGTSQFFRIDEVVRKGVALFGSETSLKQWITAPNMALGNIAPGDLIISNPGIDLVDEAIDALGYGNAL